MTRCFWVNSRQEAELRVIAGWVARVRYYKLGHNMQGSQPGYTFIYRHKDNLQPSTLTGAIVNSVIGRLHRPYLTEYLASVQAEPKSSRSIRRRPPLLISPPSLH